MPASFSDECWDDLLDFIEQGKVIPIIGEGAVTLGAEDEPFYPKIALALAEQLEVDARRVGNAPSVSDVIREYLLQGGERNRVYTRLNRLLRQPEAKPGSTLTQLAAIAGFDLFLSTTSDSLLQAAISDTRTEPCLVGGFFPGCLEKDLPVRRAQLPNPMVYHLLGRSSVVPGEFVAWEEDLLDFVSELPRHLGTDTMRNLSADLRSHALLAVGLRFSDWIVRLLLRIARQGGLSQVVLHSWLAEGPIRSLPQQMILFFGSVSRNIEVIECPTPAAFVTELHRRWRVRHPVQTATTAPARAGSGLIFISYAREDEQAAHRLESELRSYGCNVYFDRERLGPGMNFHHELEDQVLMHCALFVSVISTATETAVGETYFRRERRWAAVRGEGYSDAERPYFYFPVLIDQEQPRELKHEPRIFQGHQWVHCPSGAVPAAFGRRLAELQQKFQPAR